MSKNNRYNREFRSKDYEEESKPVEETKDEVTEELKSEEEVIEEVTNTEPVIKKGSVITQLLNIRTEPRIPTEGNNILGRFPIGTKVEFEELDDKEWFFVKGDLMNGVTITGYAMSKYIKED